MIGRGLAAGVKPHVLRKFAGHGSLATTQRYLHPDQRSIEDAGAALSAHLSAPRDLRAVGIQHPLGDTPAVDWDALIDLLAKAEDHETEFKWKPHSRIRLPVGIYTLQSRRETTGMSSPA